MVTPDSGRLERIASLLEEQNVLLRELLHGKQEQQVTIQLDTEEELKMAEFVEDNSRQRTKRGRR